MLFKGLISGPCKRGLEKCTSSLKSRDRKRGPFTLALLHFREDSSSWQAHPVGVRVVGFCPPCLQYYWPQQLLCAFRSSFCCYESQFMQYSSEITNTFSSNLVPFLIHVDLHYIANRAQEKNTIFMKESIQLLCLLLFNYVQFISIELKCFIQYKLLIFEWGIKAFQDSMEIN